jgi:uncharacterized protein (TIGR03067 family)
MTVVLISQFSFSADDKAEAMKKLEGTWKGQVDGGATGHQLVISAENIKGTKDGKQDLGTGSYVLDVSTTPWTLDAKGTDGKVKGRDYPGICSLEGDSLKWCVGLKVGQRPSEFKTGGGKFCLILTRQK